VHNGDADRRTSSKKSGRYEAVTGMVGELSGAAFNHNKLDIVPYF
jgi:hypothetical protein